MRGWSWPNARDTRPKANEPLLLGRLSTPNKNATTTSLQAPSQRPLHTPHTAHNTQHTPHGTEHSTHPTRTVSPEDSRTLAKATNGAAVTLLQLRGDRG